VRIVRPASRRAARLLAAGAALGLLGAGALAQPLMDLNELALRWTRGDWASPLVCELDGKAARGLRRLLVTAGPKDRPPLSNKLSFVSMHLPSGARCYSDTGEAQPDVAGSLLYFLDSISRPDLATREFQETLEREGGFRFDVRSGVLQVGERKVDFAGGSARFEPVRRGSDAWRRLQDLQGEHKLALLLEAKDGTRLALDLVQAGAR
jgi:hypothetical protein